MALLPGGALGVVEQLIVVEVRELRVQIAGFEGLVRGRWTVDDLHVLRDILAHSED
jgi:hypothetical protein